MTAAFPTHRVDQARSSQLDRWAATAGAAGTAVQYTVAGSISIALVVVGVLAPLWLPVIMRVKAGRIWMLIGIAAIVNGWFLTALTQVSRSMSMSIALESTFLSVTLVGGVGLLLWARGLIGDGQTALAFGIGLFVTMLLKGISTDNAWKFSLSVPTIVILLALCWMAGSVRTEVIALLGLALISALNDSRSAASILVTALVILVWQSIRASLKVRSTFVKTSVTIIAIAVLSYNLMQAFILSGYLGEGAQARSEAQLQASGSLLLGGRPEIGASVALLGARPWGYGLGIIPAFKDIYLAKTGMASLNYSPNNGYVERYMFGTGFELHSVIADFWIRFGILGLAFALMVLVLLIRGAIHNLVNHTARALVLFLVLQVSWDLFFSPLYITSVQVMTLAVALVIVPSQPKFQMDSLKVPEPLSGGSVLRD